MSRRSLLLTLVSLAFCAIPVLTQASVHEIIPAGTLLHCTVSEPNFSAKTAQIGDPVLCSLGPLGSFGHSVFPRGAQLGGHLDDAKSPGHFFGKGWMQLTFDRMILPGAQILPLEAKIIADPHKKVDAEGRIRGTGHPVRDAVEWAIPIMWPIKILTLPARGPYPALKGETRLSLRLMEDVEVGGPVAHNYPAPPWASPSAYQPASYRVFKPASASLVETAVTTSESAPIAIQPAVQPMAAGEPGTHQQMTVLALVGGEAYLARDYWVQRGEVHCVSAEGAEKVFPIEKVDLFQTASLNRQRNVNFVLQSRDVTEQ